MKHIELFAGCGGLSLGLKAAGFDLYFANEVSPMAAETFSYNIMGKPIEDNEDALWLESHFSRDQIKSRLRETLLYGLSEDDGPIDHKDMENLSSLENKLFVGGIDKLLEYQDLLRSLQIENIDLVSGGPPCQGFSMSGQRNALDPKNQLPAKFVDFVDLVKPKCVLLENVLGITRPFMIDGTKFYPWKEIYKLFESIGYSSICLMINPIFIGLPQTRVRFIMLIFRNDVVKSNHYLNQMFKALKDNCTHNLIDLSNEQRIYGNRTLLSPHINQLIDHFSNPPKHSLKLQQFNTSQDAIDDLTSDVQPSSYVNFINHIFKRQTEITEILNMESAKTTERVSKRIELYQLMSKMKRSDESILRKYMRGEKETFEIVNVYENNIVLQDQYYSKEEFINLMNLIKTRKHSQRALHRDKPSPTITALADDLVHYREKRFVTVREMARIQSFPDSFVFKSKIKTAGIPRRYEIAQQTQVGNAVPPLLAYHIGIFLKSLNI